LIGGDKQEYGPASSEQIRQWLKEGRANGETLLRPEGETLWKPLDFYPEFQADLAKTPPPIPKMSSGAAASEPVMVANVPISIGHAFGRAWHLVNEHFGTLAGACLMAWMAYSGILFFPVIGPYLEMIFFGPIFGALFLVFLKVIREGEASVGDLFALAKQNPMQLMIASVIAAILTQLAVVCCYLPSLYLQIAWLFGIPLVADRHLNFWEGLELSRRAITRRWFKFFGLFVLAFLPVIVFQQYFYYHVGEELFPIINRVIKLALSGVVLSPADVTKLGEEINAVGAKYGSWMLVKQFLLLVSMPLGIGSFAFVYEDLFGRKKEAAG
jgi:hypothetical protein